MMRNTGSILRALCDAVSVSVSESIVNSAGSACRRFPLLLAGLALVLSLAGTVTRPVMAQTMIDPGQSVGAVPGFAGTGLDGLYYYLPNSNDQNLFDAANDVASSGGPTGTFNTTNICFPDCLGNAFDTNSGGLALFTGGNANNINFLVSPDQVPNSFFQSVLTIGGYLAVPVAGTYTFSINSDDGSQLIIGNSVIDVDDGIHGQQIVSNAVTFSAAGLYPILVDYFQNCCGAGLDLTATDVNGSCILGCPAEGGGSQPNDLFYSAGQLEGAPAPQVGSGWPSLAFFAILGAGALARRRNTWVSFTLSRGERIRKF